MPETAKSLELLSGDCLLYKPTSLFGWITALKTWNKISHCEIYIGEGWSVAARSSGVNKYKLRTDGLAYVLRPLKNPDMDTAKAWFYSKACGQKYDYIGLLVFALAAKHGSYKKQFCSEFATRFYRHAKIKPFNPSYDADRVAPAQFLQSPAFEDFWRMI